MRDAKLLLATVATMGLMSSVVSGETNFIGHWSQPDLNNSCSLVFGFQLNANGTASVDWVGSKLNAAKNGVEFFKVRREGNWTSKGNTLHLTMVEVVTDPERLKLFEKTVPVTKKTDVDGPMTVDGKQLHGTVKSENIEHKVFHFKCVYTRDKR